MRGALTNMYAGPRGLPAGGSPKLHRAPLLSHHPAKRRNRLLLIGLALLALSLWYWRAGHSRRGAVDVDIQTDDPESQVDAPGEIRAGPRDGDDDGASPDDGDDVTGGDAEPDSEPQANEKYGPGWLPRGDVSKLPGELV